MIKASETYPLGSGSRLSAAMDDASSDPGRDLAQDFTRVALDRRAMARHEPNEPLGLREPEQPRAQYGCTAHEHTLRQKRHLWTLPQPTKESSQDCSLTGGCSRGLRTPSTRPERSATFSGLAWNRCPGSSVATRTGGRCAAQRRPWGAMPSHDYTPRSMYLGRWLVVLLLAAAPCFEALAPAMAVAIARADAPKSASARELEGRLIAPCCWTQTLEIHDSPIAEQLRAEIKRRLAAGEPAQAIEDDLAARYSDRIRAVPRGEDPRKALPVAVGGAMFLAAIGLFWLGLSWLRRNHSDRQTQRPRDDAAQRQPYDEQLDQELDHMSEHDV